VLLPFLLYAPLRAIRERRTSAFSLGLSLAAWAVILAASYRSGSDQWDNVRYRSAFAALQVGLAGWVWSVQVQRPDPWLRRILAGILALLAWFVPWYVRRISEFQWPVQDVLKTVGLGVATWILFLIWDWARGANQGKVDRSPQHASSPN
jgi:peptidoglycan/LPS O-acetylase OafA/YrhL